MNVNELQIEEQCDLANQIKCHELDEIVYLSILYDFYGELLKESKKQIFEEYVLNDLSLGEIAQEKGISRQGVYDIVKRCSQELKDYENRLCLIKKFQTAKEKLVKIKEISSLAIKSGDLSLISKIDELADDILKEL